MASARLKREYEIENMMQYDIVIRIRYDSFFTGPVFPDQRPPMLDENSMYCFHYGWDHAINRGRIGDIFWYADSSTYDLIGDYYLNLHTIKYQSPADHPSEHEIFFHYIKNSSF